MKVTIAVIKLILRTNKTLADGTHPIMLRVSFNGMKERSTGYSCPIRYWDKKNECVKKGYPNFVMVNAELKKQKDECIRKRDEFIASNEVYTPSMILARDEVRNALTNDLKGVIQRYIDEKGIEAKTIEKWWVVYRSVIHFSGRDIIVNEIDESFCRRYGRWCESNGLSSGSIRSYLAKVGAICRYAIGKGLMSVHPFKNWKYHLDYREGKSDLYIHSKSMEVMMEMFFDEVVDRNGKMWKYKDGVTDELMDIHSELYSHYLYIITYYCKGLAPVDISFLKKKDIKVSQVKGDNYYDIKGVRSKTGMPFHMYLPQNSFESNVLIKTMLMFNDGEYFLPTIKGYVGKDVRKRINNVYSYHSEHLVDFFRKVNGEIVRRNVENGDNIPIIDLECRYYSARHSYIQNEVQKPNVNLMKIATETGKAISSLHQYLTYLNDIDLV